MATILMCEPKFYGIEYEINPWMSRARGANHQIAVRQWQQLHRTITQHCAARVELIEPQPQLPDMVFTANAGLVMGKTFISSNFRFPVRAGEKQYFDAWFASHGYEVHQLDPELFFEGAGDMLFWPAAVGAEKLLFGGYHFRSDIRSHLAVSEMLGIEVLSVMLVDPRFYHLDTCFCPLENGVLIWYPPAFDQYAQQVIEANIPERIEVSEAEALRFACNAVSIGEHVIIPASCDELAAELQRFSLVPHQVNLSEFLKAGGSAKCLTLRLD